MKKSFLFSKIIAVGVLLLMGVSAKAVTTYTVGTLVSGANYQTIAAAYTAVPNGAAGGYIIELQSSYDPSTGTTAETYPITLGSKALSISVTTTSSSTTANITANGATLAASTIYLLYGNGITPGTTFTTPASVSASYAITLSVAATAANTGATMYAGNSITIQPNASRAAVTFSAAPTVTNITGLTITNAASSATATLSATTGLVANSIYTIVATNLNTPTTFTTGSSLSTTITLSRAAVATVSTVSATITPPTQIFYLNGAKFVTIDGLDRTKFTVSNTTGVNFASNAILIANDACNNTITNITAQGQSQVSAAGVIQINGGTTNTTGCDNNTIDNCDIKEVGSSFKPLIGVNCPIASNKHDNLKVQNCNIINVKPNSAYDAYGISFTSGANNGIIKNNKIYWSDVSSVSGRTTYGILMSTGSASCNIESNVIGYNGSGTAPANAGSNTGTIGASFVGLSIGTGGGAFPSIKTNIIGGITTAKGFSSFTGIQISTGATSAITMTGNIIKDVTYTECNSGTNFRGIFLSSATGLGAQTITGNEVSNINLSSATAANTITIRGFYISGTAQTTNRNSFSQNKVFNITAGKSTSSAANAVYGFDLNGATSLIERSLVYDLKALNDNTTPALVYGINTVGSSSTGTTIKNNMIDLGVNVANDALIYGIYQGAASTAAQNFYYYHNSVYIGGAAPASATQNTYAFYRTGTAQTNDVRNNIFANKRTSSGTPTAYNIGIAVDATTDITTCDNNLIYVSGATNGAYGKIGATNYTNFATTAPFWQGALFTTNDANSKITDPKFIDAVNLTTPDLHINTGVASDVDNNGIYIANANKDYDDDTRLGTSSKADIGADEYTVSIVYSIPTVTTTTAGSITKSTATSGVTVNSDGNATVSESGVVWSTSANPDATAGGATKSTGGSGNISSLSPNTTYFYRAYATNSEGTGYGTEMSFTTKAWTITASPNNANGTVSGAGDYANNATVTVTATATVSGKRFVNWTDNGTIVSLNRAYTFTATLDKTLQANFGDVYSTYYVRPSGSTKWANLIPAINADQLLTTDNFSLAYNASNTNDGTATYYVAAGNYTMALGTTLSTVSGISGKIYGGFSGDEETIDLNARVTSDLIASGGDANGITEPWEMTNAAIFSGPTGYKYSDTYTAGGTRLLIVSGTGTEVNGITLTDFNYLGYAGAIAIGQGKGTPDATTNLEGKLTKCIVRKIKSAIGVVMLTNPASVVDQCLIEDCYGTSYGAVYFNLYGGTLSNSVVRNNYATTEGGAIYAGNLTGATDLHAIVANCLIYNNSAGTKGGAISSKSGDATHGGIEIVNSTIVNNVTGTNASVEFNGPGLIVNSIVTGDAKADLYATSTTNYVNGVVYGSANTNISTGALNTVSGQAYTALNFGSATSTAGYLGLTVNQAYTDMRAAKFNVINVNSPAVTTTSGTVPSSYSAVTTYSGALPTTDITGASRSGDATLGAYQIPVNTWTGTTSTDWSVTTNWSLGVPATNTSAIINSSSNNPAITSNTTCKNLTINSGAVLNVNAGKQLTVSTTLTNNSGTLNLLSTNTDGTATILTPATLGGTGGAYNVQQYLTTGRNWYISNPVAAVSPTLSSGTITLNKYDEAIVTDAAGSTGWVPTTDPLAVGKGYVAAVSADGNIAFSGTLNTGNKNIDLTSRTGTANKAGFNLIGNPYPSYLDWNAVTAANADKLRSTTMWYRTKMLNEASQLVYQFWTVNGDGIGVPNGASVKIPPMQAFWVRAVEGVGTLSLTNTMRSHAPAIDKLLKAPAAKNTDRTLVRLQVSNGVNSDEAVVYFSANAQNGLDNYDAPKMSNGNNAIPEIYTLVGTEQVVINGMNSITPNLELPLGFKTGTAGSFTIKASEISNFDATTTIVLKDKDLMTEQELVPGVAYSFPSGVVNSATRFSLLFRVAGTTTKLDNTVANSSAVVYCDANNHITINCHDGIAEGSTVEVYNLIGEKLASKSINGTVTVMDNAFIPGVYLVTVRTSGKTTTQKVILN